VGLKGRSIILSVNIFSKIYRTSPPSREMTYQEEPHRWVLEHCVLRDPGDNHPVTAGFNLGPEVLVELGETGRRSKQEWDVCG
jgi:hypothetical protein